MGTGSPRRSFLLARTNLSLWYSFWHGSLTLCDALIPPPDTSYLVQYFHFTDPTSIFRPTTVFVQLLTCTRRGRKPTFKKKLALYQKSVDVLNGYVSEIWHFYCVRNSPCPGPGPNRLGLSSRTCPGRGRLPQALDFPPTIPFSDF